MISPSLIDQSAIIFDSTVQRGPVAISPGLVDQAGVVFRPSFILPASGLIIKYVEPWVHTLAQRWHSEALQTYGEKVIVRHRWNIEDYAQGRVSRCMDCSASVRLNEQQRVRVVNATGGTFTLTFDGQTTLPLPYNATAFQVQSALEALSSIDPGDVLVTGTATAGFLIEFRGRYAYTDVSLLVASSFLSPSGAFVEVINIQSTLPSASSRVAQVYKQGGEAWCTSCYGVGFEGGFEPVIYICWAIVSDEPSDTTLDKSGHIQRADPMVQMPNRPHLEEFDLIARVQEWEADGITPRTVRSRYVLGEVHPVTVRTGPASTDFTVSLYPPDRASVLQTPEDHPDAMFVIGQTAVISRIPFDHVWNQVPLIPSTERVIVTGTVEGMI